MAKIRIFSDDSFEAIAAAKPKDLKGHQERIKVLKSDVSIANKIAGKQRLLKKQHDAWLLARQATAHPKKAQKVADLGAKVKALRAAIKELKAGLSSSRHANLDKAMTALTKAQQAKADHSSKHLPRNQKTPRAGDNAKVKRSEVKHSSGGSDTKAAGIKLAGLPAGAKRNVKALAGMKDHQEMAAAIAEGKVSPNGMGNSSTVRAAGRLMAQHLSKAELSKIHKISAQHEAALNKIRGTHGSPARESRLIAKTREKLNNTGVFQTQFEEGHKAISLINGITAASKAD